MAMTCCSPKECSHWSQFSAPPTLPLTSASPALSSSGMQEIDLGVQSLSSSHNQCLGHCHKVINNHNITHQQQQTVEEVRVKVVRSVLPRPRSILLGSLFAWTVLMALSSPLGLNYTGQDKSNSRSPVFMPTMTDNKPAADITASPDGWTNLQSWEAMSQQQPSNNNANEDIAIPSPSTFMRNIRIGGFVMTEPQEEQEEVQHSKSIEELERIEKEEQEDALFMQNVVSMLDLDTVLDIPLSFPDEDWTMIDRIGEVEANEATTGTVFLNKRSEVPEARVQEEEQEEEMAFEDMYEDAFDPEDLQAMTVDPEDEHVFRDFLLRLESEDETPEAAPQPAAIPAFMDTLILDNDHAPPCGSSKRRRQRFSFFSNPAALLPAIQRLLFGGPANQIPTQEFEAMKVGERKESGTTSGPHHHVRGQVFEYLCGWSDLMILAITMCFGGLLLGLAQSRTLYQQLMDHHLEIYSEPAETSSGRDKSFWIPLISCLLISGSALTLTVVMTLTECWDVPSIYFVGIGIAGMILVHAWVPNVGLLAEVVLDFSTDDQFMEGDEMTEEQEHLIQRDIPSPYVQVFVDDSPSDDEDEDEISSPLMAERRNACSLDESRRWEVNQRPCLEPSCFSP
ncbi:hypothetical protein BGZ83_007957 [Gryganskiella cystojenkinii]|nr:hypothetical protein BGZ83_007957 [Gryganskiella cystojenkinii]